MNAGLTHRCIVSLSALLLVAISATATPAQSGPSASAEQTAQAASTGSVRGQVTDPSGAAVVKATVLVSNATGVVNATTNNYVYLGSGGSNHAGDGIINQGTINVQGSSTGYLNIDPYNFTNQGTITVANGRTLYLQPNTNLINAAGGIINVGAG